MSTAGAVLISDDLDEGGEWTGGGATPHSDIPHMLDKTSTPSQSY